MDGPADTFAAISDATPSVNGQVAVEAGASTTRSQPGAFRFPRLRKWQPVLVFWRDAVTVTESVHSKEDFPLDARVTIGHFIKRTKEGIVLAMEDDRGRRCKESDCAYVTTLPLGMITDAKPLYTKEELER